MHVRFNANANATTAGNNANVLLEICNLWDSGRNSDLNLYLPAKVQSLKRSVPKGDKKKKKEITAEIALLEAKLEEKHNKENNESDQNCKKVSILKN